ncbi:glycosyltransferase [Tardisphaera miroshnichenkoae]
MRVLYLSSSVGLGHVTRDLVLAKELTQMGASITWVSSGTALAYLKLKGETIAPVSDRLLSLGDAFELALARGRVDLGPLSLYSIYKTMKHNSAELSSLALQDYDAVIADEFWELLGKKVERAFFITDFTRFRGRFNPFASRLVEWANSSLRQSLRNWRAYYVGLRPESDPSFAYFGQIFTENARKALELGAASGGGKLITLGGTRAGLSLAKRLIREFPDANLLSPYLTRSWHNPSEQLRSADLVFTMCGYGTLLELATLKKRAILFYPRNDFEQEDNAALFASRSGYRAYPMNSFPKDIALVVKNVMDEDPDPPTFVDAAKSLAADIVSRVRA